MLTIRTLTGLASGEVKSVMGAVALVVVAALAFGSFFVAYRKRQASGAGTPFEQLALRFCVTPFIAFAAAVVLALATSK